jgi:cell division protein FtsN
MGATSTRTPPARPAARSRAGHRRSGGGTLIGILIGIIIGLALAVGVAFYLMKSGNPFKPAVPAREPAREAPKAAAKADIAPAPGAPDKPRFDFYRILPGGEEPKPAPKAADKAGVDKATVDRVQGQAVAPAVAPNAKAPPGDRFWLQAGSFAGEADAENLKAQLAMNGLEAVIQSAPVPDKGMRYRVRLGPYDNTDELNRIKGELSRRGFEVAVIKY